MALLQIDWNPPDEKLRQFGLILSTLLAGIGTWLIFRGRFLFLAPGPHQVPIVASALFAAALLGIAVSCRRPRWMKPAYQGLTAVTYPIGYVVSHLVMAGVFFGVITPLALFFRLTGRDALKRRFEPDRKSYWEEREATTDVARYFRQF